jgi:dATP pyrophosphohydrolase
MPEIPIRSFLASLVAVRQIEMRHEVLLLKRTQTLVGEWCQVAGKIEEDETAWQTALRELDEETGLRPNALYSADTCEQFYEADRDAITMSDVSAYGSK